MTESDTKHRTRRRTHLARAFVAGAATGFIAGAFAVSTVVWQYGNVIGSKAASRAYPREMLSRRYSSRPSTWEMRPSGLPA